MQKNKVFFILIKKREDINMPSLFKANESKQIIVLQKSV